MADDDRSEERAEEAEEDQNQYGGGDQEIDAVEQTERVTDEDADESEDETK